MANKTIIKAHNDIIGPSVGVEDLTMTGDLTVDGRGYFTKDANSGNNHGDTVVSISDDTLPWLSITGSAGNLGVVAFGDNANSASGAVVYDHNTDKLSFQTVASTRLTIDSAGDVGIGTDSPGTKLHIDSDTDFNGLTLERSGTHSGLSYTFGLSDAGGGGTDLLIRGNGDQTGIALQVVDGSSVLRTALMAHETGNVGIGQVTPTSLLHLTESNRDLNFILAASPATDDAGVQIRAGSGDYMGIAANTGIGLVIDSSNNVGIGTTTPNHKLDVERTDAGSISARVHTQALANNQSSYFLAVGNNRQLQAGVHKHSGITNPCAYLNMQREDGTIPYIWVDNTGDLRTSATATHIGTTSGTVIGDQTSDERLKSNIVNLDYGLTEILALQPIRYDMDGVNEIGFGAQTTQTIVPEAVYDTGDLIDGLDENSESNKLVMKYARIVPVLVNAIKELEARLAAVEGA